MKTDHIYHLQVTFGDCDPAGIVFYPNMFRWMDASFHHFLRTHGGHAAICKKLDAVGLGLIDASAQFKRPLKDGDKLDIHLSLTDWSNKTVTIKYTGKVGDRTAFESKEVRALFKPSDKGITAGELKDFKTLINA